MLERAGGGIAFRFHARDVNLVIRSRDGGAGALPRAARRRAAPATRTGSTSTQTATECCSSRGSISSSANPADPRPHVRDRLPDAAGAEAYVFTFG